MKWNDYCIKYALQKNYATVVTISILNFISELRSDINFANIRKSPPENLASLLSNVTWTKEDAFRRTPCTTFGKICFVNNENSKPAKVFVWIIITKKLPRYAFKWNSIISSIWVLIYISSLHLLALEAMWTLIKKTYNIQLLIVFKNWEDCWRNSFTA